MVLLCVLGVLHASLGHADLVLATTLQLLADLVLRNGQEVAVHDMLAVQQAADSCPCGQVQRHQRRTHPVYFGDWSDCTREFPRFAHGVGPYLLSIHFNAVSTQLLVGRYFIRLAKADIQLKCLNEFVVPERNSANKSRVGDSMDEFRCCCAKLEHVLSQYIIYDHAETVDAAVSRRPQCRGTAGQRQEEKGMVLKVFSAFEKLLVSVTEEAACVVVCSVPPL